MSGVVQRLDTVAVAGQQQGLLLAVPQGQGKHAVESEQGVCAPLGQGVQDDFAVGLAAEPVAGGFKLSAQFAEVIDLAVVAENEAMVSADHRLMAVRAQVDDSQAPMAKPHVAFDPLPFAIRPAMVDGVGHPFQDDRGDRCAVKVNEAGNAAHQITFALTCRMTKPCSASDMPWNKGNEMLQSLAARAAGKSSGFRSYFCV